MKDKKINIFTLGCSKNVVDSEKLLKQLNAGGYEIVYDSSDTSAGTVIVNTCGFINDAKEESIDTILRFVKASKEGKIDNLYVMGCLSERYMDALKHEIPEVKKYFGVNNMTEVLNELGIKQNDRLLTDRTLTGPGHYAYLKIAEGCDRTCAFCAIPGIRGQYVSRPVEELVSEATILANGGVKELILIAQDLSYYGLDLYKKQTLPNLVKEILKIEKLDWIRLHYLYPANFPMEMIPLIRDNPRICRYIDIPVQHITDNMLGLMKRSHNRMETENILNRLRHEIPGSAIRTTLIAGHPGETKHDFSELRDFIARFRFDRLGVFKYSHEEDTYSFKEYKDEISEDIKESRVAELMEIQQKISSELNEKFTGRVMKVIIDRREEEFFTGRTEYDSPEVDQEVLIPVEFNLEIGKFYNITITCSDDFDLYGELHG
ncbi:MAG: ribosomal protein S12 methylthiotransferase RimO [Bacteroidetes bacterium GWF2_41_9]|nr:MAG: ribosomal protein S12 methylthiotransferase RimO [Bacteroidetes bacterium GWC2_40_22]OFY56967.1 MAG: ribosomal protein S12 methylthiotransferase RimO [Bacteroidetes bacterium GWF2_41_9]HAM11632.1 30S ribosomal protein S12 methylthiotransferase RimO [Bacteroidales bacterium]HBH83405.1 30S ribosomal protein S12 methylthiotransferase RimO [Bacteroidales bacterium]